MVSLAGKTDDRLDFIKLLQGIGNAEIAGERCVVIGADPKEKKFYPVTNVAELDAAKLSQVLNAYIDPAPRVEVFALETDDGVPFVLLVIEANPQRPILITKQGHTEAGKVRLEPGKVWIKKNTGLVRATRADLDLMYSVRIEEEAEDRARKRLRHLLEISPTPQPSQASTSRAPISALLVGPKNDLRSFADDLIAAGDLRRFRMLLELARGPLIDGWDNLSVRGGTSPADITQFAAGVSGFFRDEFLPSVQSVVELGLLIIKYEADESWFTGVIDVLVDAFDASKGLNWLKSGHVIQQPDSLRWWRPALEIYAAIRTVAIYAIARKRLSFLGSILPRTVTPISIDDRSASKTPIVFWPFLGLQFEAGELDGGRAPFFWKERVASAWGKYFGTVTKFLESSSQLELLLEFNSYLATNTLNDTKLKQWLALNVEDISFFYFPDLYGQDLQATVPMAERIYDILSSSDPRFPRHLAVDVRIFDQLFGEIEPRQRLEIYAGFLYYLKTWQSTTMFQQFRRFPFTYNWQGRLQKIVAEYDQRQRSKLKA
jgi:hypothetical protein